MVTTTLDRGRLPHPLQSGPTAACLWIGLKALSLVYGATLILLLPAIGRHFSRGDSGSLMPDGVLMAGAVVFILAVAAKGFADRKIQDGVAMRTPGMMRGYADTPVCARPSRGPDWVASLLIACTELGAAIYVATHATAEHGVTALMLMLMGVVGVGVFVVRASIAAFRRQLSWGADLLELVILRAAPAIGFFILGSRIAPSGELSSPETVNTIGLMLLGICIFLAGIKFAFRELKLTGGGSEIAEFADEAAEGILDRYNAAPTVKDRQQARAAGRSVLYLVLLIAAVALIGIPLLT